MERIKVNAIMESGAHDIVIPAQMIGANPIRDTKGSKSGYVWHDVKGNTIQNKGESDMQGSSLDGIPLKFVAQVSDEVTKLIMSVRKAVKKGNMVIFGADMNAIKRIAKGDSIEENVIVDHKTGTKSIVRDENGMYVYPMIIRRKKKTGDPMDIGMVQERESDKLDEWSPF